MLYLLAGKHGLQLGKEEHAGGTDAEHHRHHHHQRQVSDDAVAAGQHGHRNSNTSPAKKKLVAAKSLSAYDHLESRYSDSPMCKHQAIKEEIMKDVHVRVDIEPKSKYTMDSILREDGEEQRAEQSGRSGGPVERKASKSEIETNHSPSRRKRSAYCRSETCKASK